MDSGISSQFLKVVGGGGAEIGLSYLGCGPSRLET